MHLSDSTNKAPPFGEAERVTQKSRPALWEPGGSCYAVFRTLPEVCRLVVQALVALGGDIPAEIALHAVMHEVLPVLLVIVSILCVAAGHIQLVGIVARKGEAVALAHGAVVDGVAKL